MKPGVSPGCGSSPGSALALELTSSLLALRSCASIMAGAMLIPIMLAAVMTADVETIRCRQPVYGFSFTTKANLLKGEFASLLSESFVPDPCDTLIRPWASALNMWRLDEARKHRFAKSFTFVNEYFCF